MPEFQLIQRLQQVIDGPDAGGPDCVLGIGDDAALLESPPGRQLVVCTDSLVEGVHFAAGTDPAAIGHKALAVNLSDLAAMAASPAWFFLALTLPEHDEAWIEGLAAGMAALASDCGIRLAGGDVSKGALNLCVTAIGLVEPGAALTRSGASAGDLVVVSGEPGAAANALRLRRAGGEPEAADAWALDYPQPRLRLGRALAGLATSCIDLSDGLLADLGHVLAGSCAGASIELSRLPTPASLNGLPDDTRWTLQTAGGDDYELCFTLPPEHRGRLAELEREGGVPLTVIGSLHEGAGIELRTPDGACWKPAEAGYQHFAPAKGMAG